MNDLIDQHHNLIIYLLEELEKVKNERDEYKFKIANIYHILNNDMSYKIYKVLYVKYKSVRLYLKTS